MPGSVYTQKPSISSAKALIRTRSIRRGKGQNWRQKISQMMRAVGVSIIKRVMISGYIDDLSMIQRHLPKRENSKVLPVPRHQPNHCSLHHSSSIIYMLNQQMDEYSRKVADITPQYLLGLSKQIDTLSRHYLQQRLGSLTQDFSNTLTAQFNELTQYLNLYHNDTIMRGASLFRCKAHLQLYTLNKITILIGQQKPEVGAILQNSLSQLRQILVSFQNLILEERQAGLKFIEQEKDKVILKLRRQVLIKREYTQQLEERVRQLEDQNSQLYSKLITTAKQTSDFAIRTSPTKIKQLLTTAQLSISQRPASPRKKVSVKTYEDEVLDILQSKFKQQSIQQKNSSLDQYLHTYFTVKYGKPLAEQNQYAFRQAIGILAKGQQKHLFMLFQAILEEVCEEAYYFEDKIIHEKIVKCIKRYLNQRYNKSPFEIDRLLDWKNLDDKNDILLSESDLEPILSNVYKSTQVHTLQMILNEIITSRSQDSNRLTCKRLLTEILNYQLSKHLLRVDDIVRQSRRMADGASNLTFQQLEKIMIRLIKDKKRYELLPRHSDWVNKKFTFSKAIEIIEKIRRTKIALKG